MEADSLPVYAVGFRNINHALPDMVLARCPVSVASRLYREECRNGNVTLLFWRRMASASHIDIVVIFYSRSNDWRSILFRQDIQAKTDNHFIKEKISFRAG